MNAQITPIRTHAETELAAAYGEVRDAPIGSKAAQGLRADAFARFSSQGLPHRRVEAWHYTDLRNLMREALPLAPAPSEELIAQLRSELATVAPDVEGFPTLRLIVIDGIYVPALSDAGRLPAGVSIISLADALTAGEPHVIEALAAPGLGSEDSVFAINAALMQGGLVIEVAPGTSIAQPFEIILLASAAVPHAVYSRSLVRLAEGASATLVERHVLAGPAASQANHALVVSLADSARLDHVVIDKRVGPEALRLTTLAASLGVKAEFSSFAYMSGGGLSRRQIFARFDGAEAEASFSGAGLLKGADHSDTTLVVEHVAPACVSREFFKHIVGGDATGVFQGKVIVAPGAQKSDGGMKSHAILLSDHATMNNKPELEIFADDVVCGHGATTGELDETQIFYAQSRGLPRPEAEDLLLEAFVGEAVERVANEALRKSLMEDVRTWLAERWL